MTLPAELQSRIEEIRNDFTNGSSVIAWNVLNLLADAIKIIDESDKDNILDLAKELLSAKPHMAGPTNILEIFNKQFPRYSTKSEIANFLNKLNSDLLLASDTCVSLAIEKLIEKEKTSILTCSYSSNVFNIISSAKSKMTVYILQSIWNGIDYGEIWIDKLSDLNVECNVLSEDDAIPVIDFALIGADAVLYSGDIINGIPSLYLAKSMKKIGIPLFVVAESFKKCKQIPIIDGFEQIPNELISDIITDDIFNQD